MAVLETRTFKDVQDSIIYYAKLEDSTTVRTSLKRQINTEYELIAFEEEYDWSAENAALTLQKRYTTGTITVTNGSDQITGSGTTWTEVGHRNRKLRISGSNTPFKILRIGSTTTATLETPWDGDTASSVGYTIYRDEYGLFPNCKGIRALRIPGIAMNRHPLKCGPTEINRYRDQSPFRTGTPLRYCVDGLGHYAQKTWATFNLQTDFFETPFDDPPKDKNLIVWPGVSITNRMALIRYTKKMPLMDADADEPLIPREVRSILVWRVLVKHYLRSRDPVMAREWKKESKELKKRMAGDIDGTDDQLQLVVDRSGYSRQSEPYVQVVYESQ